MMDISPTIHAGSYLDLLVGCQLEYRFKSPDCNFYEFIFHPHTKTHTCILHVLCCFKIIERMGDRRRSVYTDSTDTEKFYHESNLLFGLPIHRIALSEKNDLWLDFGDYWVVFITTEDDQECWRFFTSEKESPHLVASHTNLDLQPVTDTEAAQ